MGNYACIDCGFGISLGFVKILLSIVSFLTLIDTQLIVLAILHLDREGLRLIGKLLELITHVKNKKIKNKFRIHKLKIHTLTFLSYDEVNI